MAIREWYGWTLSTGSGDPLTLAVSSGSPVINVTNQTLTITAALAGTSGLTKTGPGTLTLSGANTYSGVTTVSNGTLITSGTAANMPTNVVIASGATYHPVTFNGAVAVSGSGLWEITSDVGAGLGPPAIYLGLAVRRPLAPVCAGGLERQNQVPGGLITVASGGEFWLDASGTYTANLDISGNSWAGHEMNGAIRLNKNGNLATLAGTITLDADAGIAASGTVSANISGPYQLELMSGTINLSGNNAFDSLLIDNGCVGVAVNASSLPTNTLNIVTGGQAQLSYTGTKVIASLILGGNPQAAGIYGSIGSGATYESADFAGPAR